MNEQKITTYRLEDHARLDRLFEQFLDCKLNDAVEAMQCFTEFRNGLQRHIAWEEEILFPLFERLSGRTEVGPTSVFRMEHRQIRDLLETIGEKLQTIESDSSAEEAELASLLERHTQKEEDFLYPGVDKLLSPEERETVLKQMLEVPEDHYKEEEK